MATLTYDYSSEAAWLDRLAPEAHPMTHDLCDAHAERLSVPRGWRLEDRRMIAPITAKAAAQAAAAGTVDAAADEPRPVLTGLFHSQLAS